jgi:hypothetical protein
VLRPRVRVCQGSILTYLAADNDLDGIPDDQDDDDDNDGILDNQGTIFDVC